jgi:hypothetical protein
VAHAFNPSTWEAETGRFLKFGASLIYRVSSRTARAIQRNPVLKNQKRKKKKKEKKRKRLVICSSSLRKGIFFFFLMGRGFWFFFSRQCFSVYAQLSWNQADLQLRHGPAFASQVLLKVCATIPIVGFIFVISLVFRDRVCNIEQVGL